MSENGKKRATYAWNDTVKKLAERVGSDIRSSEATNKVVFEE